MQEASKREETSEEYPVRRVCAWCNKDLGLADYTAKEPGLITHVICKDCKEKYFGKKSENKSEEKNPE